MPKRRYLIGGVLVLVALGALLYTGFRQGSVYYYTIEELKTQSAALADRQIRVAGDVEEGSVNWEAGSLLLTFTLIDGNETLPVSHNGVVADTFQEGREVVVSGKYGNDGVFLADSIITKCPSKYAPGE
jgi:cytochrome c-type biogenesis protein CcmE